MIRRNEFTIPDWVKNSERFKAVENTLSEYDCKIMALEKDDNDCIIILNENRLNYYFWFRFQRTTERIYLSGRKYYSFPELLNNLVNSPEMTKLFK